MQASKAPKGFYTVVDVRVRLANEKLLDYGWATPMALPQAYHKALAWTKAAMVQANVGGRSRIVAIDVLARYRRGAYQK